MESSVCNQGFCLDSYPEEARNELIGALSSKDIQRAIASLSRMFDLTEEQKQKCADDFQKIKIGYGFKAPNMPEGTNPADTCFAQLSIPEQAYWRKEYTNRQNCGVWIHLNKDETR